MTRLLKLLSLAPLLLVSLPAQADEGDWYVAPSIIWFNDDPYRALDESLAGAQVAVGRNLTQHLSLEGLLGYSAINAWCVPGDCYPDQKHLEFSANLLTFFNRDATFAPYILLGVGYLGVDADEGPQYVRNTGSDNRPTASVGLGFKWHMGQSNYSIRGEYQRPVLAFGDPSDLNDQLLTLGVQYNFGGVSDSSIPVVAASAPDPDAYQDSDQDRINDNVDQCPNTPIGHAVDRVGCSLDSDMDGVVTGQDRCPASRAAADVDIYGCENDKDNDGVVDHRDDCLGTRAGARTDVKGCEIKDIISLPGVNFETGRDVLLPGMEYLLQAAADTLNKHPDLQIEVAGHSDDVGDANLNIGLSMRRAKTVRDFLIRYGVEESRLTFKGYGEAQPIADNSTADGRATNRRVELRLVSRETQ